MFWKTLKPSDVLFRYLDGNGRDRELDDFMSGRMSADENERFLQPLLRISQKYAIGLSPGLLNVEARQEIRALAERLKGEGF